MVSMYDVLLSTIALSKLGIEHWWRETFDSTLCEHFHLDFRKLSLIVQALFFLYLCRAHSE